MKEQIISFELAKKIKDKGFGVPSSYHYEHSLTEQMDEDGSKTGTFGWEKGEVTLESGYFINNHKDIDYSGKNWYMCSAPTQSLLQKWFRDNHKLHVEIQIFNDSKWRVSLWKLNTTKHNRMDELESLIKDEDTYEEALEKGLEEALKLIK